MDGRLNAGRMAPSGRGREGMKSGQGSPAWRWPVAFRLRLKGMIMTIELLEDAAWDEVGGGWVTGFARAVGAALYERGISLTSNAVVDGAAAFGRWVLQAAPMGADDSTWTASGHANMGA